MTTQYLYRIPLPLTVDEYQIAQLYTVAEFSKQETGANNGIEVLINEPFNGDKYPPKSQLLDGSYKAGQYTLKNYYLQDKFPTILLSLIKKDYMTVVENAWNAYPFCRTVLENKMVAPEKFQIIIESFHHKDINLKNPHNLKDTSNVTEVTIDIGDNDYANYIKVFKQEFDTNLKGLSPKWYENHDTENMMCCYKLVTLTNNMWFLGILNSHIFSFEEKLFADFHRRLFCYTDKWRGMTMEQIREYEEVTKRELQDLIKQDTLRGITSQ